MPAFNLSIAGHKTISGNLSLPDQPTVSNLALLPLAKFVEWQDGILASRPNVYRVRKWGDPVLGKDTGNLGTITPSNFQAVALYNKETGFGGVSNYLWLSWSDLDRVAAMQVEDEYQDKVSDWRNQKMRWMCKSKGTIYFYGDNGSDWKNASRVSWGTIALGGNLVAIEGIETLNVATPNGTRGNRQMARLAGFRKTDWNRSFDELLASGLMHRCFCAYSGNGFGDSPKGIGYSPFYSPLDWDFAGNKQPTAFYLPLDWLTK